jgi:endonuclease/exonuclease/phosphatase family metal-dependent hydrolase
MTGAHHLTLATYNMRKAVGLDRKRDPHRILQVLEEVNADIISLQEADRRTGGRGSAVPHELWEGHSPWRPVPVGVKNRRALDRLPKVGARVDEWLKVDTRNIGWHGNAILVDDRPIRIVGLHLDLSGLWRRRQLKAICEAVAARSDKMPTVMMGDTNEWRATAACLRDLEPDYAIVAPGPSFHARRPMAVLDRLFVDHSLTVQDSGVHNSELAQVASDHLPVWARVGW